MILARRGFIVRRSTIQQARVGNGGFAGLNFAKEDLVWSNYGLLAYGDLTRELRSEKQFVKGYLEITDVSSRKWAEELEEKVSDSKGQKHSVWIV